MNEKDEALICISENRDIYAAWRLSEITSAEAAYLVRRGAFLDRMLDLGMPVRAIGFAGWIYDRFFERRLLG